jgi:voltage-gated potassium channel
MAFLAFVSVYFAWQDYSGSLVQWQSWLDTSIWILFIIDYIVRLIRTKNRKAFFKENIFDLLAILPFNSAFRAFRALRFFKTLKLLKVFKLFKLTKVLALIGRLYNKAKRFLKTNGFQYMLALALTLILIAGVLMSFFEDMTIPDAIWWAFVTTTTVGYGDISPASASGRIIACILMITGIGLIGSLTSAITTFFMHPQEETVSSDKVDMVFKMYNELNDSEKSEFRNMIK